MQLVLLTASQDSQSAPSRLMAKGIRRDDGFEEIRHDCFETDWN